ncbi:type IV secretion system DNA-binding domain-containing protein [bacterium]|nr:type IV secretion system DNA-binding domain-containing protein [bacterium]
MSNITFFAKTNFRNQETTFGIKTDDRRRHMYIVGKTGMGKTNLLENLVIQDIKNGQGVCYIDPHGDTSEKLLKAIPSNRINDVIYFNPADAEFPIAFNILEAVSEDKKNLVASGMMGVFKKIWPDVWSARMEYILNNTILALLDYPGSTMLGVNRMMSDKDYRKRVYLKIKDPVVKSFWINEFDKWDDRFRKEAVAAIQNKVGQFISSSVIRHIVGQPKSTIDMRDIMDNQKILIVNLSKGKIGEDSMRLLGGMVITKIQLAAMGRVEIPEEERKDFYLHVDEFQNFATESFANILSEARKYRLNLILAHQYIKQLIFDGNTTVCDAVFGNVGTIVSFRVGADDAEYLEKEFEPVFMMNDIVNLPKYNIYLKLMIDGIAGDAFSAITLPPVDMAGTEENEEKIINISRERYASSKDEVEEKIARWSGVITPDVLAKQEFEKPEIKQVVKERERKPERERENNIQKKVLYDAVCDTCGAKIQVPFKPDSQRPTFCKECLRDYQSATAKSENQKENEQKFSVRAKQVAKAEANERESERESESESESERLKNAERKVYTPKEKPITFSQMQHIAPKKFKPLRKKAEVDLKGVRDLIKQNRVPQ